MVLVFVCVTLILEGTQSIILVNSRHTSMPLLMKHISRYGDKPKISVSLSGIFLFVFVYHLCAILGRCLSVCLSATAIYAGLLADEVKRIRVKGLLVYWETDSWF